MVNLNKLEIVKDSFIDANFRESFVDLLYRTEIKGKIGYFYFLFEHKSSVDKKIAIQLNKYLMNIWGACLERGEPIPIVIPIVIYHGQRKWNIGQNLKDMLKGYDQLPTEIKKYIPQMQYVLYDLSKLTDEQIKGYEKLRIVLMILRDIWVTRLKVVKSYYLLFHNPDDTTDFFLVITYILYVNPNTSVEK